MNATATIGLPAHDSSPQSDVGVVAAACRCCEPAGGLSNPETSNAQHSPEEALDPHLDLSWRAVAGHHQPSGETLVHGEEVQTRRRLGRPAE
jgi:hypothetical protein